MNTATAAIPAKDASELEKRLWALGTVQRWMAAEEADGVAPTLTWPVRVAAGDAKHLVKRSQSAAEALTGLRSRLRSELTAAEDNALEQTIGLEWDRVRTCEQAVRDAIEAYCAAAQRPFPDGEVCYKPIRGIIR